MANVNRIIVDLQISAEEYLKYYQGISRVVYCHARDGRRIQFPADILQRFVTRDGVSGSFRIEFDAAGKFVRIERV